MRTTYITCDRCGDAKQGDWAEHGGWQKMSHAYPECVPTWLDLCNHCVVMFQAWLKEGDE